MWRCRTYIRVGPVSIFGRAPRSVEVAPVGVERTDEARLATSTAEKHQVGCASLLLTHEARGGWRDPVPGSTTKSHHAVSLAAEDRV